VLIEKPQVSISSVAIELRKDSWDNCKVFEDSDTMGAMANVSEKQILLIEDDRFLSSLLKNRLEKEGLFVVLAEDGAAALRQLETLRPGLIMLDIILPGQSGFEVLEKIRSDIQMKDIPIIITSNLGQEEDMERVKKLGGVVEYFVKARTPIDDLVKRVKELCR